MSLVGPGGGPPEGAEDRVSYQVIATSHELRSALEEELAPLGVSLAQWTVLVQLVVDPGRSSADIARSSAVSQQAISALVARLERDGLLTREAHPEHGRIQRLATTDRGRDIALSADTRVHDLEGALRDHLGADDAAELRRLLLKVRGFLAEAREGISRDAPAPTARS